MTRNLLSLTVAILFLAAYRQLENVNQLREINEGLERANDAIGDRNRLVYESLR